jgi:hypothetical protein
MGLGVGIANMAIARWAASATAPETAMALRTLPPRLSQISTVGLGVLIVTGILLLFDIGFGTAFQSFWFWLKMISVAGMIAVVYVVYQAQAAIKAGREPQFKEYLPMAGMILGVLGLAATLFAVIAFNYASMIQAQLDDVMRGLTGS